jgi:hypothetical protein
LAAGAADPELAGAAAAVELEGAAGGSGPELTTPLAVRLGSALALEAGGAFAIAFALAVGAPAGGVGCVEQLTSAANHGNTTPNSICFGWFMPQH